MSDEPGTLPPLCYIRHPETGDTVAILRGENGWHPANTRCSPECLNAKLAHPPTPEQVLAMKHGSLMGWDTPGRGFGHVAPSRRGRCPVISEPGGFSFLLGLPALRPSALWSTALRIGAPVLISANALSRWRTDSIGLRHWDGFDGRHLGLVHHHPVALDSAGFTAAHRYRGFPWSVDGYLDLAAAAPWLWWAAMDLCVEPEIAGDDDEVLNRLSGTVRLNMLCRRGGERRAIADRFVPVLQGWHPHHYLRCLDRVPWAADYPLVGIGSMCRRHIHGEHGILHVLDVLDREFSGSTTRFHLFGLKSQAIALACQHHRVASADSQAYGVAARQDALRSRSSKSDVVLANTMAGWYARQRRAIASRPTIPEQVEWPRPPQLRKRGGAHTSRLGDNVLYTPAATGTPRYGQQVA